MSIPPNKVNETLTAAEQSRVSAAIGIANQQNNMGQAKAQMLASLNEMAQAMKTTEHKIGAAVLKYWPVAAGLAIAATRFIR